MKVLGKCFHTLTIQLYLLTVGLLSFMRDSCVWFLELEPQGWYEDGWRIPKSEAWGTTVSHSRYKNIRVSTFVWDYFVVLAWISASAFEIWLIRKYFSFNVKADLFLFLPLMPLYLSSLYSHSHVSLSHSPELSPNYDSIQGLVPKLSLLINH